MWSGGVAATTERRPRRVRLTFAVLLVPVSVQLDSYMPAAEHRKASICSLLSLSFYYSRPSSWETSKSHFLESVRRRVRDQATIGNSYGKRLAARLEEPHASYLTTHLAVLGQFLKQRRLFCQFDSWARHHFGEVEWLDWLDVPLLPLLPHSRQIYHHLGVFVDHCLACSRSRYSVDSA